MAKIRTRTQARPTPEREIEPRKVGRPRDGETLEALGERVARTIGGEIVVRVPTAEVLGEESAFGNGALLTDETGACMAFVWFPRAVHRRSAYDPKKHKGGNAHSTSTGGFRYLDDFGFPGCAVSVNSKNAATHRPVADCAEARVKTDDDGPPAGGGAVTYVDDD